MPARSWGGSLYGGSSEGDVKMTGNNSDGASVTVRRCFDAPRKEARQCVNAVRERWRRRDERQEDRTGDAAEAAAVGKSRTMEMI